MRSKNTSRHVAATIINYTLLVLLAVILIFPFFLMLSKSLMTEEEVVQTSVVLLPKVPQFGNYIKLFSEQNYFTPLSKTLIVVAFNCIAIPLSASLTAFALAKLNFIGKKFMFALMMSTVMLPAIVTHIPLFSMFVTFGWIDTLLPLTIPNLFGGGAMNVFLIRQFMMSIPKTLNEAAKIDGAGAFRRYWEITVPLCFPILAYVMVVTFIACWGDYYAPSIFLTTMKNATLAYKVYVDSIPGSGGVLSYAPHLKMASGVIVTIIPAILFFFFQKQLVDGIATVGIKG